MEKAIRFYKVTKSYRLFSGNKEKITSFLFNNKGVKQHKALQEITFSIPKGEVVGIVGVNGSGKSTMSNMIAGVSLPSSGEIKINGSVALISISSGFNNQLTGIENIRMKGLMLGLTKEEVEAIIPEVIEFADIGKFIYQPMKTYSSGMKARLGFAISIRVNPDILVIDEALSVGDQTFTNKCLSEINKFKQQGKTIIFISHSLSQVRNFCEKVIWIHKGKLIKYGPATEVISAYSKFIQQIKAVTNKDDAHLIEQNVIKEAVELEENLSEGRSRSNKKKKKDSFSSIISFMAVCISSLLLFVGVYFMFGKEFIHTSKEAVIKEANKAETKEKKMSKVQAFPLLVPYIFITQDKGNIRAEASVDSVRMKVGQFGEGFQVISEEGEWFEVKLEDKTGWIHASIVEKIEPTTNVQLIDDSQLQAIVSEVADTLQLTQLASLLKEGKDAMDAFIDENPSEVSSSKHEITVDESNRFVLKIYNKSYEDIVNLLGKGIIYNEQKEKSMYISKDLLFITVQSLEDGVEVIVGTGTGKVQQNTTQNEN